MLFIDLYVPRSIRVVTLFNPLKHNADYVYQPLLHLVTVLAAQCNLFMAFCVTRNKQRLLLEQQQNID
jgi:hypothetical protein